MIGSYGIYCLLLIIKVDFLVLGECVFLELFVCIVVYMMESVVLFGGGGVKVVIKGYCIVIKIGMVKKVGLDGCYINKYIVYIVGVVFVSYLCFVLVVVINDLQVGKYYGGVVFVLVFGVIMGGVLCIMNIELDVLVMGEKSEFVIN